MVSSLRYWSCCLLPPGIGVAVGLGPPARAANVAGVGVAVCCLPLGTRVAVGLGPPARAADVAGVGVAVCCPQVLELLCAVFP